MAYKRLYTLINIWDTLKSIQASTDLDTVVANLGEMYFPLAGLMTQLHFMDQYQS